VPKASDVLADEIRERILRGDFRIGSTLPTERELVEQTRMSRSTVREALRILEVQGFVEVRAGRTGGAVVQAPGVDSVASSVSMLIRGRRIRLMSLLETRETLEPSCAELAARHRTDDDLAQLEAANEALASSSTSEVFLEANVAWHVAVAAASHNELLTGFMQALSRAIYTATDTKRFTDSGVHDDTLRAHRSVTEAIRSSDAAAAARRMRRHVHAYVEEALNTEEDGDHLVEPTS
jgi:DNA-binding FadR family transcriptional regulator